MARIRTVKPEFFQHEEMASLSPHARLLAIALLQIADRFGRLRWVPMAIHAHAFPYEPKVKIEALASELESIGYLKRWQAIGKSWAWIVAFQSHQVITGTETKNKIRTPEPPENLNDLGWNANGMPVDSQWQSGKKEKGRRKKIPPKVPPGDVLTLVPLEPPGPTDEDQVWEHWRKRNQTAFPRPGSAQLSKLRARIADLRSAGSPDPVKALCAYIDWITDSDSPKAKSLREGGHVTFKSIMRPSHVEDRMPLVRQWVKDGSTKDRSAEHAAERWWRDRDGYAQKARGDIRTLRILGQIQTFDQALDYIARQEGAPPVQDLRPIVARWWEDQT